MSRKLRNSLVALGVGLLALLGLAGSGIVSPAGAVGVPAVAVSASVPVHSGNIECAKDGTGTRSVWNQVCPRGYHWRQVAAQDVAGLDTLVASAVAKTPAVAVDDSPVQAVVVRRASLKLDANSPATQTLIVDKLPVGTSSLSVIRFNGDNLSALPSGPVVTVSQTADTGPQRAFKVTSSGFTATQSFTLTVDVLAVTTEL